MWDWDPLGLPRQGEVSSRSAMSPSSKTRWEGASGWQPGLAARAGSSPQLCPAGSPDSHLPFLPDKYYRVNLRTKRVDLVQPRYPRSIAQYWLDCPQLMEKST